MTQEKKFQIKNALQRYMNCFPNRMEMLHTLPGIAWPLMNNVLTYNWHLLQQEDWQLLARKVGFYCDDWNVAETGTYLMLNILFNDAGRCASNFGLALAAGSGKTFVAQCYAKQHPDTIYIKGSSRLTKRNLLAQCLKQLHVHPTKTVNTLLQKLETSMQYMNEPLIIIDDAQKLKPSVLQFLAALMQGKSGMIIMGTENLLQRLNANNKLGKELCRLLGKQLIKGNLNRPFDAALVCVANGITEDAKIRALCRRNNNLHHISMAIQQLKMMAMPNSYACAA